MSRALFDAAKAGNLQALEAALAAKGVDLEYAPPVSATTDTDHERAVCMLLAHSCLSAARATGVHQLQSQPPLVIVDGQRHSRAPSAGV